MNPLPDAKQIEQLFLAYNDATGFGVPFNMAWERVLFDCARMGLTPEMLVLVIKDRLKGIQRGDRKPACLMPRNLFYGEDNVNEVIVEAHALLALKRKVVSASKESVLRSWRPLHEPETPEPRCAKAVLDKAISELRQAIQ